MRGKVPTCRQTPGPETGEGESEKEKDRERESGDRQQTENVGPKATHGGAQTLREGGVRRKKKQDKRKNEAQPREEREKTEQKIQVE